MPSPFPPEVADFLHPVRLLELFRALVIVVGGLLGARLVSATISRVLERRASAQHIMLIRRAISWLIVGLTVVTVLRQLGFDLGVLVGAAGVFTVALGFASQTSASNLISGLFLIGERPFVVGDIITVGTRTGEVTSIDLLSVKLRTFDNLFVRIPNETLILWGEKDRMMPASQARVWAERIPNARVKIIPNVGHFAMQEDPKAVTAIGDFLAG